MWHLNRVHPLNQRTAPAGPLCGEETSKDVFARSRDIRDVLFVSRLPFMNRNRSSDAVASHSVIALPLGRKVKRGKGERKKKERKKITEPRERRKGYE